MRFVALVVVAMCASCNDRTKPASPDAVSAPASATAAYAPVTTVASSRAVPDAASTPSAPTPQLVDLLPPEGTMGAKCTHVVSDAAHVEETLERDGRTVAVAAIVRAPGDASRFQSAREHLNGHGLLESGDTTELYAHPFIVRVSKNADAKARRAVLARFDLNGLMVEAERP